MTRSDPKNIKDLFSYRLGQISQNCDRMAAIVNEGQYGIGLRDWRIIGLLNAMAPLSLNTLAEEAGIDKSQASRSVADLIERGLVKRSTDEADARGVKLDLTAKGKNIHRRAFPKAGERNEEILSPLTVQERAALERALDKLVVHTSSMLEELKEKPRARGRQGR